MNIKTLLQNGFTEVDGADLYDITNVEIDESAIYYAKFEQGNCIALYDAHGQEIFDDSEDIEIDDYKTNKRIFDWWV